MDTTVVKKEQNGNAWKSVLIGGIPGIMLGAVGGVAAAKTEDGLAVTPGEGTDVMTEDDHEIQIIESDEGTTFAEAFAEARAELGPGGVFEWNGSYYNTFYKEEWDAMSAEEKEEFLESFYETLNDDSGDTGNGPVEEPSINVTHVNETHVNVTHLNETHVNVTHVNVTPGEVLGEPEPVPVPEPEPEPVPEPEIHVISVQEEITEDGILVTSVDAIVDGQDAIIVDVDGDGVMDVMSIDANYDNEFSAEETEDIEDLGLTADELNDMMDAGNGLDPSEQIYADSPDYVNDADVSSFA